MKWKIIGIIIFFNVSIYCKTTQKDETSLEIASKIETETSKSEIFEHPYFLDLSNKLKEEAIRVLIMNDKYTYKQIGYIEEFEVIPDPVGDQEQLKKYREYDQLLNFKDWNFEGVLKVKLNPHSGSIEKLHYHPNFIPKMKQALQLFMDDASRYRFRYLNDEKKQIDEFYIRMQWIIQKDPNLTEEQSKQKAIEYIKRSLKQ
ncbi:MAG: hypothetical protein NZ853_10865 [Leptospiraceae bacterium]|nr:hypothetical protein [Leptospiraceae bacterium]MDW7977045.1 hypothetical protein [Leptospiraceae bacterium]